MAIRNSDLQPTKGKEVDPKKGSRQILIHELTEGITALDRSPTGLFISGLSAGLDIGFSVFLIAVMTTVTEDIYSRPTVMLLSANMYAVGFLFVVIGRSELFTEQTTLAVLPVIGGQSSIWSLARLWGIVLGANLIGTALIAGLIVLVGPPLGAINSKAFGDLAHRLVDHHLIIMFASAMLAGWLMGLLSWLVAASRDTVSQIIIVWIIAMVIGLAGLHHSIIGSVEVLGGIFTSSQVTWLDYGRFLSMTVLGNAVGGSVFVALIKYGHATNSK